MKIDYTNSIQELIEEEITAYEEDSKQGCTPSYIYLGRTTLQVLINELHPITLETEDAEHMVMHDLELLTVNAEHHIAVA